MLMQNWEKTAKPLTIIKKQAIILKKMKTILPEYLFRAAYLADQGTEKPERSN